MVNIVVGGHYGDEGKGKMVSYLAVKDNPPVIARAGVGPNAGHTVYKDGKKYGLRMIPCGFVNDDSDLLIGPGVLVDAKRFIDEVKLTKTDGRIWLDERCSIIEEKHKKQDLAKGKRIGTTGSGCGPASSDRVNRTAIRAKDIPELRKYVTDVPVVVNGAISDGKEVLIEATQGFGLSLYYGNYPYVTSKDTSASMAAADIGVGPTRIDGVIIVFKAYMSRVGKDPYVNYLSEADVKKDPVWSMVYERAIDAGVSGNTVNEKLAEYLGEKGTVTGRPRKIGKFDFELAKYSSMVNSATQACVTCIDKLFPDTFGVTDYDDLSKDAAAHVAMIEKNIGVNVTLISTGPGINDVIDLRNG